MTREVLGRLARVLELDQPQLRASLVASQLIGLAMLRYVIKVSPSRPQARTMSSPGSARRCNAI